jgi:putative nucleotidyltransferase with HDIG domain
MQLKNIREISASMSVLYVEDDEEISEMFIDYLKKLFKVVIHKTDGLQGLNCYKEQFFDLVITDVQMPIMDGLKMSSMIKEINSEQSILILSAYSDLDKFERSIKIGIDGYILKPIDYDILNVTLYKALLNIKRLKDNKEYEERLKSLIDKKSKEIISLQNEKIENYRETLIGMVNLIESRDIYTGKHSLRVANYSKKIAIQMGYSDEICEDIYKAGILHDIGKIAIPDTLLLKPTNLNKEEFTLMKLHVDIGVSILEKIPMYKTISEYIAQHHERVDGTGYPKGLKNDDISTIGNILALADSFDAITTNRIYKNRKNLDEALEELKQLKGIHFKEEIVDAAVVALKDIIIDLSISQLPVTNLEKERFSYFYKDGLTNFYNDKYLDIVLNKNVYEKRFKFLNLIFLNNFGKYNKKFGWTQGDELLKQIAQVISKYLPIETLFRIHGDDFVILNSSNNCLNDKILGAIHEVLLNTDVSLSIGSFDIFENEINTFRKLEILI